MREVSNRRYGSSSSTNMISMYRGPEWPRETVAWDQAAAYCAGRGGRLPREAEWEFAARGPDNLIYPWGDAFTDQYMGRAMGSPSDVGSEADDVSWVGAVDLGGSVSEWVADWYGPYSADRQADPTGPTSGAERSVRGGNWFSFADYFSRTSYRQSAPPDFGSSTIGFRCVRDFEG